MFSYTLKIYSNVALHIPGKSLWQILKAFSLQQIQIKQTDEIALYKTLLTFFKHLTWDSAICFANTRMLFG